MIAKRMIVASIFAGAVSAAISSVAYAELSTQDKQFVADAGSGGMLEVRLGEYASDNAQSPDVKKLGEHMAGDHSKANDQLKTLATQETVEIPKTLNEKDQKVLDELEKLKGAEFDKAYLAKMVEDHKQDISDFEKEIKEGSDPSVKAFAEKVLPTLKHHLEMVEALNK